MFPGNVIERSRATEARTTRIRAYAVALVTALVWGLRGFTQSPTETIPLDQSPRTAAAPVHSESQPMVGTFPAQVMITFPASPPPASPSGSVMVGMPGPGVSMHIVDDLGSDGLAPSTHAQGQGFPLQASWDNGLILESADQKFRIHVGGIGQIDSVWLIGPQALFNAPGGSTSGVGNAQATDLRRAILQADGTIFDQFDYMIQFDFANASNENSGVQPPSFGNLTSSPAPLNIWMQIRDVPYLGNVRAGNQTKPIGMTNNTSAAFLPFMERADNNDAFYGPFDNGFALGITAQNWTESERMTWRYGIFQPATNVFGVALNKYSAGARVTALPWYEDEGKGLMHVGLGFWEGDVVQDELRVRARPLLRNAPGFAVPVLVDTSEVPGSRQYTIAPEFAMVLRSWTVQAEWTGQFLTDAFSSNSVPQGTVFYHGGYIQALYFLTGEHQDYLRREGVFGRVVPRNDYHVKTGDAYRAFGAWQVGVRFSYLDLNDKAIQGGNVYDWTVGLNWFLNPNMKVQLNYILEHRDMPGVAVGWINGIGLRAGYDF
jgi:phosphate-selective porin OprO/OprP